MNDIESKYCDLPTGVYELEVLPRHEITGWNGTVPNPSTRWYGIGVYKDSLKFSENGALTEHGDMQEATVTLLVVNDDNDTVDLLAQMKHMRFVLRIKHYDGRYRIVGAPNEYCEFTNSTFAPEEIVGAQGYSLSFAGKFSQASRFITE